MKYNRGPLVPQSIETRGKCLYSSFSWVKKRYQRGTRNPKNLSGGLLAQERHKSDRKSKARFYKIYKREAREVHVEEGSGQTQAAADHKGAFKPKPLSFRLLALTSLEVQGCLWSATALLLADRTMIPLSLVDLASSSLQKASPFCASFFFRPGFPPSFNPQVFLSFDWFHHLTEC